MGLEYDPASYWLSAYCQVVKLETSRDAFVDSNKHMEDMETLGKNTENKTTHGIQSWITLALGNGIQANLHVEIEISNL